MIIYENEQWTVLLFTYQGDGYVVKKRTFYALLVLVRCRSVQSGCLLEVLQDIMIY